MKPADPTTIGLEDVEGGPLSLRVIGEGILLHQPLPEAGVFVIGRGAGVDLKIDDPSISRKHARIHLGDRLAIEDLGSANGTKVRGKKIAAGSPQEISCGEPIDLGSVLIVLERAQARRRTRRLWTHGYFEGRLEDECARADAVNGTLAVVRLKIEGSMPEGDVHSLLVGSLGPADMAASYAPGEYELLLIEADRARAEVTVGALGETFGDRHVALRAGIACFPRDGRTPDRLVARAGAALRGGGAAERSTSVVVLDPAMKRLYALIDRVAQGEISVLLLGETGVGKEVIAEAIHRASPRHEHPYLRLNCGAVTETLLESELFGYERGAFTGADRAKPGLLETAQGGTVLLDEIGEMTLSLQVKLLRVIEHREVLRLGSLKSRAIDVRFIAATNRDLEEEIARGRFRQDLYFRLNGVTLQVPPLRERPSEIASLARAFVEEAMVHAGRSRAPRLSREVITLLERYSWPGNIRELRNFIERAVLLADDEILPEHLPLEKMQAAVSPSRAATARGLEGAALKEELDEIERRHILETLEQCAGNQSKAARILGISRSTLLARLERYGVPRPRKR